MVPPRPVRRVLLPVILAVQLVAGVLVVLAVVAGLLAGAVDRRWRVLRGASILATYLGAEWCALVALAWVWLGRQVRGRAWADAANLRVLGWALRRVLASAERALGFRVEVTEPPDGRPMSDPSPVLVLARHGGVGDSIALVSLLIDRYGRRPSIALKGVLAWDPLVDAALSRLGACFLPPSSRRRQGGSELVAATAARLEPHDAMLLFPEGMNWTPGRWRNAVRRLRTERVPAPVRKAELMEHVLPPRWGGVSACLDARPDLSVAVFAHTGLDKITSIAELWRALPFEAAMRVRWWPSLPPPKTDAERIEWLIREWAVVDEWIDSRLDA